MILGFLGYRHCRNFRLLLYGRNNFKTDDGFVNNIFQDQRLNHHFK
jgi:hypothetical protein